MVNGQKYHILYKTTCTVTGNFYIGVHSTTNLEDGYLGSGKRLSNSIQKHGKENHIREILEFFDTREELLKREAEVVNSDLLQSDKCMNLKKGGEGGGGTSNWSKETIQKVSRRGQKRRNEISLTDSYRKNMSESMKHSILIGNHRMPNWNGRKHRPETIEKFSQMRKGQGKGEKNSQFGTIWITNGKENKKQKKDLPIPEDWRRGKSRNTKKG